MARNPIRTQIQIPQFSGLTLPLHQVVRAMAAKAATLNRQRGRKGLAADGSRLPVAKDKRRKKPMNRSGDMLKSIRARRVKAGQKFTRVEPTGKNSDGVDNFKVYAINHHTRGVDLIGLSDSEARQVIAVGEAAFEKVVAKKKNPFKTRVVKMR